MVINMRFYVIKIKYVIMAAAVILAAIVLLTVRQAMPVFKVGNREIPIYNVNRDDNKVALTFDSAWNDEDIDEIIDILNRYNVKATFFVTGKWAEDYSSSLNKLYRNGFEIGIHSYNHTDYTTLSKSEILNDMEKCDKALLKATGSSTDLVRAPSGSYDDNVVRTIEQSGRFYIQWSVDGLDYLETTPQQISQRVTEKLEAGDIILLHNGTQYTKEALPIILEKTVDKFEYVNVSDMIYKSDYSIDHAGKQWKN